MHLIVGAVGRMKRGPERDLLARYAERLPKPGLHVIEVPEGRDPDAAARKRDERARLEAKLPPDACTVLFDERGLTETSSQFAQRLARARDDARPFACIIGGPDGLDPDWSGDRVSFGRLTIPHQIVRVLVAEQIYRATTILAGHPYHRQ